MADTKAYPYNPVSVQQAHQGQESDQAKPPPLAIHALFSIPGMTIRPPLGMRQGF